MREGLWLCIQPQEAHMREGLWLCTQPQEAHANSASPELEAAARYEVLQSGHTHARAMPG